MATINLSPENVIRVAGAKLFHAVSANPDNALPGKCNAWMDSADKVCGLPELPNHPHLCKLHLPVAVRRLTKEIESLAKRDGTTIIRN